MGPLTNHYQSSGTLWQQIEQTLTDAGIDASRELNSSLLAPIDQLHIGGRQATQKLLDLVVFKANCHVLEIGSGLGGTARLITESTPCNITAVDITPSFSEAHQAINRLMELDNIQVVCADACEAQVPAGSQDIIISQHTLMNIPDKTALLKTLA